MLPEGDALTSGWVSLGAIRRSAKTWMPYSGVNIVGAVRGDCPDLIIALWRLRHGASP